MRIRSLVLTALSVVAGSTFAAVATGQPSGATYEDPDVCQKPKNPPKNAIRITGTAERDWLIGTEGNDIIRGLGGNDIIIGLGGNDMICGGGGEDRIYGGPGNDRMWGNYNNDWFDPGPGNDQVDGGLDGDTISFASATAPVSVVTGKNQYRVGNGPLEKVVRVYKIEGTKFGDTIDVKDTYPHEVQGGSGNDKMIGRWSDYWGADDILVGGPDDDKCRYNDKPFHNCS
jgi:Ca2+-binding RTX toxin-like protein